MSAIEIWEQFPILQPGTGIHLTAKGGTLFVNQIPYSLNVEQADFLRLCDGIHMVKEIIHLAWSGNYEDFKFIAFISQMISEGRLKLIDKASQCPPRVTGSKLAYIPPHMSIELTAGCNLRCRHCYRESDSTKNKYMPTSNLFNILQRLADAGLRSVELTGGEPLLHKDFLNILSFCKERFELVGVLSNGTILTQDIAEVFECMGNQLLLSISLDGSTAAAHDMRRGSLGAFQSTTKNIKRLCKLGVKVRVSMCVDEESFTDIEDTLLLARELGAVAFSYTPVLPLGRGKDWAPPGWNLDGKQVMQAEGELIDRYKGFLTVLPKEAISDLESKEGCGAGYRTYTMDPWGRIRPCATFESDELVIGSLMEQSVEEVFSHPVTNAFAELPVPNREICGDCRLALFCRYCGLRGFRGSQMVLDCKWKCLPPVQRVLHFCQPTSTK